MARMGDIRRALAARMRTVAPDELQIYPFVYDGPTPPCMWIEPDRKFRDYQLVFGGDGNKFQLILTIAVGRMDEESAQNYLDNLLDDEDDSSFVNALHGMTGDPNDALTSLISYVDVDYADAYGTYKVGDTYFFGAQVHITVVC